VKDTDAAELIRAVRVVADGESLLSPRSTRRLISEFAAHTREARSLAGLDDLTRGSARWVALIARACPTRRSRATIYVSPSTVKTHAARR